MSKSELIDILVEDYGEDYEAIKDYTKAALEELYEDVKVHFEDEDEEGINFD